MAMPNVSRARTERRPQDDVLDFDITQGAVNTNLGTGQDRVRVSGDGFSQVRLTFTSAEVGNRSARDSETMANQDGGLAVRAQIESADGSLTGPVSRFDDEGITFVATGDFTFDVRDLVSGVGRGDHFTLVQLGTQGTNRYVGTAAATYINAGMGDDLVNGGGGDDFLVGGAGADVLRGGAGNDGFIGGADDDVIVGGRGDDTVSVDVATAGADRVNLGQGMDTVTVTNTGLVQEVRLTFTSAEVGNGAARDAGTMANQDGGLAVRMQSEGILDLLTGPIGRYDDEGITFVASGGVQFDVRDLVSGTQRGNMFDIVSLGTSGNDTVDGANQPRDYYVNGGTGNDAINTGSGADFLVGGVGDDVLNGARGDDQLLGGTGADTFVIGKHAGDDTILDFVSGTDTIDLTRLNVNFRDLTIEQTGGNTTIGVDVFGDDAAEITITLTGVEQVVAGDFAF
jgi:Ca2+-binding RTX toxin-like protein